MYDKEFEDEIRSQEIALFGGCLEDPKYSFSDKGVGFAPTRDTRQSVSKRKKRMLGDDILFTIQIDYEKGQYKYILPLTEDNDKAD